MHGDGGLTLDPNDLLSSRCVLESVPDVLHVQVRHEPDVLSPKSSHVKPQFSCLPMSLTQLDQSLCTGYATETHFNLSARGGDDNLRLYKHAALAVYLQSRRCTAHPFLRLEIASAGKGVGILDFTPT